MTKPPRRLRDAAVWLVLLICIGAWIMPQASLDYRRARWAPPDALLFLPTGDYLDAASLGYQTVIADALYLWSIQYYGHHRTPEGRRYLWRIYDVITDLDPAYEDVYLTGALVMAIDMGDPELAIRLLDKGAELNPGRWIYPVEAGHYAWMSLGDHDRAAFYFDRALALEGVPGIVRRMRAAMAEYSGDARSALALWVDIYESARADGDERIEAVAYQHVYDLKVGIDLEDLGVAIRQFRIDRGRPPRVLEALVSGEYLDIIPVMPTGEAYEYDAVSGRVTDPRETGSRASR